MFQAGWKNPFFKLTFLSIVSSKNTNPGSGNSIHEAPYKLWYMSAEPSYLKENSDIDDFTLKISKLEGISEVSIVASKSDIDY